MKPIKPTKNNNSFKSSIVVTKSCDEAYLAIKNFRAWWSEEIDGNTDKLGETFFYHYKDIHLCKLNLSEAIPGERLVYQITDNEFSFVKDKSEWIGTKLIFDITQEGDRSRIDFTHEGLVPAYECYQVCDDAWSGYINNSLKNLIETGIGNPNPKDKEGFNATLARKWGIQ